MKCEVTKRVYYIMENRYLEVGEVIEIPNKYLSIFKPYIKEFKKKPVKRKKTGGD